MVERIVAKLYPSTLIPVQTKKHQERSRWTPTELRKLADDFRNGAIPRPIYLNFEHMVDHPTARLGEIVDLGYDKKQGWLFMTADIKKDKMAAVEDLYMKHDYTGVSISYELNPASKKLLEISLTNDQDFEQAQIVYAHNTSGEAVFKCPIGVGIRAFNPAYPRMESSNNESNGENHQQEGDEGGLGDDYDADQQDIKPEFFEDDQGYVNVFSEAEKQEAIRAGYAAEMIRIVEDDIANNIAGYDPSTSRRLAYTSAMNAKMMAERETEQKMQEQVRKHTPTAQRLATRFFPEEKQEGVQKKLAEGLARNDPDVLRIVVALQQKEAAALELEKERIRDRQRNSSNAQRGKVMSHSAKGGVPIKKESKPLPIWEQAAKKKPTSSVFKHSASDPSAHLRNLKNEKPEKEKVDPNLIIVDGFTIGATKTAKVIVSHSAGGKGVDSSKYRGASRAPAPAFPELLRRSATDRSITDQDLARAKYTDIMTGARDVGPVPASWRTNTWSEQFPEFFTWMVGKQLSRPKVPTNASCGIVGYKDAPTMYSHLKETKRPSFARRDESFTRRFAKPTTEWLEGCAEGDW
jgi:hypothetical protein